jgi:ABC-type phosphate/phosphonate transport system substrate-binding protein
VLCSARSTSAVVAAALAFAVFQPAAAGADFYLFSPDWSAGKASMLTSAFRRHLLASGLDIYFQAFARYDDFVERFDADQPDFVTAPEWIEHRPWHVGLLPLARPLRDGRPGYRKALVVGAAHRNGTDLAGASIAVAAHAGGSDVLAKVLSGLGVDAGDVRVIPVPKDIDALLALGFQQVDAALVVTNQIEMLAAANPIVAEHLEVVALSDEIPFPLFYATSVAPLALRSAMTSSLAALDKSDTGTRLLALLGCNGIQMLASATDAPRPSSTPAPRGQEAP